MTLRRWIRTCLIIILLCGGKLGIAQVTEWSNTQKIRNNSVYTTILGEDENGIYMLRHRNKNMSRFVVLERYRHNLGLEISKSYILKNARILYADVNEMGIMILKLVYDKKDGGYNVIASNLNNSFEIISSETTLLHISASELETEPQFLIKTSPDHRNYFLFYLELLSNKSRRASYFSFDVNLKETSHGETIINKNHSIESFEVATDNQLQFLMLFTLKKNKNQHSNFAIIAKEKDSLMVQHFSDSNYYFEELRLLCNAQTGEKGITGLYTTAIENGYEGDFSYRWHYLKTDTFKPVLNPFSKALITEIEDEATAKEGFLPTSYKTIKIILRSNGGYIKVNESSFMIKDQEIIMMNGVASTLGKNVYNFENVFIQNFDSSGKLVWESWVKKNQSSVNDGGMLGSVFIYNTESSIYMLYNDPISNGGDIVEASFTPEGQRDMKIVAKGDEMNAMVIPLDGKQISGDKIVIPVLKDRKFALLKITAR